MKQSLLLILALFLIGSKTSPQEKTTPQKKETQRLEMEKLQTLSDLLKYKIEQKELENLPETRFRLNIEVNAIDSILKNIPVPKNIEILGETIRVNGKEFSFPRFLTNPPRTERKGIVKFGGDVIIGRDEWVNGDVVIFGGNATVYGTIQGGIIVLGGDIRLTSTSYVQNDVICIGGNTDVENGAQIKGKTSIFNFGKCFHYVPNKSLLSLILLVLRFLRVVLLLLIGLIIYTAFPTQTERIRNRIRENYAKSLIVGCIGLLLLPALFIVLLATILGIPIAVLLLPLATLGGFLLGGIAFALLLGQTVQNRAGLKISSAKAQLVLGIFILELPYLLNKATLFFSPVLSTLFLLTGILIFLIAWIPGFGAVLLTRFGTRP